MSRDGRSARKVPGAVSFGLPSSVVWSPAGDRLLVLHEPRAGNFPGRGVGAADAYSIDPVSARSRLFMRQVIPLGWYRDGVLYLRGRYVRGETVFEIRIARPDGSGSRLLGVKDEEDVKVGSYPVRQASAARLKAAIGELAPPSPAQDACLQRLRQLVQALR